MESDPARSWSGRALRANHDRDRASWPGHHIGRRVRSWLRMNAGGAPNTCKSNGTHPRVEASGERLSNTWRTRPLLRDSLGKPWVIPDDPAGPHGPAGKAQTGGDGSAAHQVDGGVTAHRADDG